MEKIESIIEDVSKWKENRKSIYYDSDLDAAGFVPSKSAREILEELDLKV